MSKRETLVQRLFNSLAGMSDDDIEALSVITEKIGQVTASSVKKKKFLTNTYQGTPEEVEIKYKAFLKENEGARAFCCIVSEHPSKAGLILVKANYVVKE
jgi:hypothetical protein